MTLLETLCALFVAGIVSSGAMGVWSLFDHALQSAANQHVADDCAARAAEQVLSGRGWNGANGCRVSVTVDSQVYETVIDAQQGRMWQSLTLIDPNLPQPPSVTVQVYRDVAQ